jgi:hypothetical protein
MCARWVTGETLGRLLRDALDVPVRTALACAIGERDIDPSVIATTAAPAVAILLARTRCSFPVLMYPPVLTVGGPTGHGELAAVR